MSPRLEHQVAALERRIATVEALLVVPASASRPAAPSIMAVAEAVATAFEVPLLELLSDRRDGPVTLARHVAMHLARRLTAHSYPAIGRVFHRDHSSVISADRRVQAIAAADAGFAATVEGLARMVVPQPATPQGNA